MPDQFLFKLPRNGIDIIMACILVQYRLIAAEGWIWQLAVSG